MSLRGWNKKKYFISLSLFVAIVGLLTIFGDRGLIRVYKLSKERDSIKNYNEKIKAENTAMKEEMELLKNDDKYIELIARKELGMVGRNELVYQFEK
ncbi:MAG: septum formation initiator family protein [Deltaproteobacteria bacterium]